MDDLSIVEVPEISIHLSTQHIQQLAESCSDLSIVGTDTVDIYCSTLRLACQFLEDDGYILEI